MFKHLLIILSVVALFVSCEQTEDNQEAEVFTFVSSNVKTGPANYFSFASNSADTLMNSSWDIMFASFSFSVPISDTSFMTISSPYIAGAENLGVARVDAVSLDDVTEVPGSFPDTTFTTIDEADNWYDVSDAHVVEAKDYVYVVNTADGKYPAFEITNYYDDMGESGVYTVSWKYLSE